MRWPACKALLGTPTPDTEAGEPGLVHIVWRMASIRSGASTPGGRHEDPEQLCLPGVTDVGPGVWLATGEGQGAPCGEPLGVVVEDEVYGSLEDVDDFRLGS